MIVNRDESGKTVLGLLNEYCAGKLDFICGVANKEDKDYENFNSWLKDTEESKSRLVYMDTSNFQKYFYQQDLTLIND